MPPKRGHTPLPSPPVEPLRGFFVYRDIWVLRVFIFVVALLSFAVKVLEGILLSSLLTSLSFLPIPTLLAIFLIVFSAFWTPGIFTILFWIFLMIGSISFFIAVLKAFWAAEVYFLMSFTRFLGRVHFLVCLRILPTLILNLTHTRLARSALI